MDASFQDRLLPGERIVWQGSPASGLLLTGGDALMIPFSLFWCGFAFFWMGLAIFAAYSPHAPASALFFPLFGLPFVAIGIYLVLGRFVIDAWVRGATHYAVTDRRVLILRTAPTTKFTATAVDRLPQLSLTERADGRGSIRFQPALPMWGRYNGGWSMWTPGLDTDQFFMIPGARRVFALIQNASGDRQ